MKIRCRLIPIIVLAFTAIFLMGCSPSHVLYQIQDGKQFFTYVDFQRNHKTYELSDTVNPELLKTLKILGFEGDKYLIELSPQKDTLSFQVTGSGFDLRQCTDHMHTVLVRARESLFAVTVKGPSGTGYHLKITRL